MLAQATGSNQRTGRSGLIFLGMQDAVRSDEAKPHYDVEGLEWKIIRLRIDLQKLQAQVNRLSRPWWVKLMDWIKGVTHGHV